MSISARSSRTRNSTPLRAWSRSISAACRAAARPPCIDGFEFRVMRADRRRIETPARDQRSRGSPIGRGSDSG